MINRKKDIDKNLSRQGAEAVISEPNKIGASTPYDFEAKSLTAYGGLLPVATMLERLGFQQLVKETLTVKRIPRAMSMYQFVLAMVLAAYVGFSRLYQLRFVAREPMLTGIVKVLRLPPQCTFWRFLASLHLGIAQQLLRVQRRMRERVWQAGHVGLRAVTLDTDTTIHTLFGNQMGGRKGYNPKNKGKKLSTDAHVSGGDARVHQRCIAQRRSAYRSGDSTASEKRVRGAAPAGGDDFCAC